MKYRRVKKAILLIDYTNVVPEIGASLMDPSARRRVKWHAVKLNAVTPEEIYAIDTDTRGINMALPRSKRCQIATSADDKWSS